MSSSIMFIVNKQTDFVVCMPCHSSSPYEILLFNYTISQNIIAY